MIHASYLLSTTLVPLTDHPLINDQYDQSISISPKSSQEFSPSHLQLSHFFPSFPNLSQVPRRVSSPSGPWRSRTCATAPPRRRPTRPWRTAPPSAPSAPRPSPRRPRPRPARRRCQRWCGPPPATTKRERRHHCGTGCASVGF